MLDLIAWNKETDTAMLPERLPVDLEWARFPSGVKKQYNEPVTPVAEKPIVEITNIEVAGAVLTGAIYWAQEGDVLTITGDCALPDGDLIVMAEQVIDASIVVSDNRFKAVFLNGKMTITARFDKSGNYMITQERINRGLDRINSPVNLAFDKIEIDVYV